MNDKEDYIDIGEKMRQKRALKGLSQNKLARLADMNAGHYASIERGEYSVKLHTIVNIAAGLNCSLDTLLADVYDPASEQFLSALIMELRTMSPAQRKMVLELLPGIKKFKVEE